jgi:hypothetical protein
MFVIFGRYTYRHAAMSTARTCAICGHDTLFEFPVERASHLFFVPLVPRGFRRLRQCTHCAQGQVDRLPRTDRPARVLARYVAAVYAVALIAVGLGLAAEQRADARTRARAAAPQVGDLWTVDFVAMGMVDPDDPSYGRLRVNGVAGDEVSFGACDLTADRADAVEARCIDFSRTLEPTARGMIDLWIDHGAVRSVDRTGDPTDPLWFAAAGCALLTVVVGLLARRRSRRSFAGAALPRAIIAG